MSDSFGMMEGAYFISKNELISWINEVLKLNLTKVEQLGTGAVYAQLFDVCYPGEVAISKLNWKARLEWEFTNNFKVLQQAFQKHKISKHIEVEKLVKAKPLDNLEFAQWMKKFYENRLGKECRKDYDPVARRNHAETDFSFVEHKIPTKANLDYHNYHMDSGKRVVKGRELPNGLVKKTKLNNGDALHFNKENKETISQEEYEKVKRERDSLREKLSCIELMAMNANERSDEMILKQIKDYLGIIVQRPEMEANGISRNDIDDNENLLTNEPEEAKDVLMLIEGESI